MSNRFVTKILSRFYRLLKTAQAYETSMRLKHRGQDVVIKDEVMLIRPEMISIGDKTYIGERCYFRGGGSITVGKYCQIASNVIIATTNHLINGKLYHGNTVDEDVFIGDNVWIGSGAMIMPGVSIGDNTVVAAGAVVTKNFGSNLIIGGVPARVLKEITEFDS